MGPLEMAAQMSMEEVALWASPTREFDYLLNERSEFRKWHEGLPEKISSPPPFSVGFCKIP
jgi:hypothetical protein